MSLGALGPLFGVYAGVILIRFLGEDKLYELLHLTEPGKHNYFLRGSYLALEKAARALLLSLLALKKAARAAFSSAK